MVHQLKDGCVQRAVAGACEGGLEGACLRELEADTSESGPLKQVAERRGLVHLLQLEVPLLVANFIVTGEVAAVASNCRGEDEVHSIRYAVSVVELFQRRGPESLARASAKAKDQFEHRLGGCRLPGQR